MLYQFGIFKEKIPSVTYVTITILPSKIQMGGKIIDETIIQQKLNHESVYTTFHGVK